jgi:hypothetical protein
METHLAAFLGISILITLSTRFRRLALVSPRPASPRQGGGLLRHPAGVGEGTSKEQFDLGVEAAKLVLCPPSQCVVHGRVDAEEDRLAVAGHEYSVPVLTTGDGG